MHLETPTRGHIHEIARTMIQEDARDMANIVDTWTASAREGYIAACCAGATSKALVASNGEVIAVGGYSGPAFGGQRGSIWFLTSEAVRGLDSAGRFRMVKALRAMLKVARKDHPGVRFENVVHTDHASHIKLLKTLGASFGRPMGKYIPFTI